MTTRVADLSVDELKLIIQETVSQAFIELFRDPDEGMELCEDFANELRHSLKTINTGGETVTAENVAARLGLSW